VECRPANNFDFAQNHKRGPRNPGNGRISFGNFHPTDAGYRKRCLIECLHSADSAQAWEDKSTKRTNTAHRPSRRSDEVVSRAREPPATSPIVSKTPMLSVPKSSIRDFPSKLKRKSQKIQTQGLAVVLAAAPSKSLLWTASLAAIHPISENSGLARVRQTYRIWPSIPPALKPSMQRSSARSSSSGMQLD
jgi:hypothetical protein